MKKFVIYSNINGFGDEYVYENKEQAYSKFKQLIDGFKVNNDISVSDTRFGKTCKWIGNGYSNLIEIYEIDL